MVDSDQPKRTRWNILRILLWLFILLLMLIVIDLVFVTSLGTNASKTFNTVQMPIGPSQSGGQLPK